MREEVASLKSQAVQYAQHVAALQNESAEQLRSISGVNAQLKALQSKVRWIILLQHDIIYNHTASFRMSLSHDVMLHIMHSILLDQPNSEQQVAKVASADLITFLDDCVLLITSQMQMYRVCQIVF